MVGEDGQVRAVISVAIAKYSKCNFSRGVVAVAIN